MTPEASKLIYNLLIAGGIIFLVWTLNRERRRYNAYIAACKNAHLQIKGQIMKARNPRELPFIEDEIHSFYKEYQYKVESKMLSDLNGQLWALIQNKSFQLTGLKQATI